MGEIDLYTEQKEACQVEDRKFTRIFTIDQQPWKEYYREDIFSNVKFSYDIDFLYLEFISIEKAVEAKYRSYNGKVHEDSCLEFFVRFDEDESYYNLEVNIMGNIKLAYGKNRFLREFISANMLDRIERSVFIKPLTKNNNLYLESRLNLKIPLSIFSYNNISSLENHRIFANFYKCGGGLEQPYYLCWNYIRSENPDFHQPEFFKLINGLKEI